LQDNSQTTVNQLTNREHFETGLRHYAGAIVPEPLPPKVHKDEAFPKFLGMLLLKHIQTASQKSNRYFKPIFNFYYKDGAPMVTVGGMIAKQEQLTRLEECPLFEKFEYVKGKVDI
jgi:hypothetical protein